MFGRLNFLHSDDGPLNTPWRTDAQGRYFRLLRLDPNVETFQGLSAVYLLWRQGRQASWIYAGKTADLSVSIARARDSRDVLRYEGKDGVYITWSPVRKKLQDGVVNYLRRTLSPDFVKDWDDHVDGRAEPVAVRLPE